MFLPCPQEMLDILEPFENVGEVMLTSLVNDDAVRRKLAPLAVVVEVAEDSIEETVAVAEADAVSPADAESEAVAEVEIETVELAEASAAAGEEADEEVEDEAALVETVDPMVELQAALDIIMAADIDQLLAEAISIEDSDEDDEAVALAEDEAEQAAAAAESDKPETEGAGVQPDSADGQPEVLVDAFGQPIVAEVATEAVAEAVAAAQPITRF